MLPSPMPTALPPVAQPFEGPTCTFPAAKGDGFAKLLDHAARQTPKPDPAASSERLAPRSPPIEEPHPAVEQKLDDPLADPAAPPWPLSALAPDAALPVDGSAAAAPATAHVGDHDDAEAGADAWWAGLLGSAGSASAAPATGASTDAPATGASAKARRAPGAPAGRGAADSGVDGGRAAEARTRATGGDGALATSAEHQAAVAPSERFLLPAHDAALAPTGPGAAETASAGVAMAPPMPGDAAGAVPSDAMPTRLAASPGSAAFAAELGATLTTFVRQGIQHARLELHPAEMGPLTVQIQLDGQSAQVHLAAENGQTRQALEQSMPQLAGSLREAGLTLTGGGVFEQPRPRQDDPNADTRGSGDNGRLAPVGPFEPAPRAAASGRRRGVVDLVA